jgi:predicted TIM-barrel fold metal-dependent hydrolase
MTPTRSSRALVLLGSLAGLVLLLVAAVRPIGAQAQDANEFYDSHFHLTNYIQKGIDARDFLKIMGTRVGRSTLFGIPLQQQWSYANSGDFAPTYYLQSDAPLYYYSFTDAYIASVYKSLSKEEQARFDPMITGFNPADMYGVDHIRRVLQAFPGVFTGIGEFSIHKEFVSSKVAGDTASLTNPALDRVLDFAAEAGLVVIIHNDIDMPFAKQDTEPVYLSQMKALLKRHQNATIIWAHIGLGRVVRPVNDQAKLVEAMLDNPRLKHVYFDLSWTETAKYIVASNATVRTVADVITKHPDRFLFGTDEVAPDNQQEYLHVYRQYQPLWDALPRDVAERVKHGNYERIFDEARRRVRTWEQLHAKEPLTAPIIHRP